MPQVKFALDIAGSTALVRSLGKSWGMGSKHCKEPLSHLCNASAPFGDRYPNDSAQCQLHLEIIAQVIQGTRFDGVDRHVDQRGRSAKTDLALSGRAW